VKALTHDHSDPRSVPAFFAVHLEAVEVYRVELSLVEPMVTATGTHLRRPVLIVRVRTTSGVGYGECAALIDPTYTEEYTDGAAAILSDQLIPRLLAGGSRIDTAQHGLARLAPVRGHSMAKAALEMALLDAQLHEEARSLAEFLGATRAFVEAGATIGMSNEASTSRAAEKAIQAGYKRIKAKIAPGHDVGDIARLRERHPLLGLVVDANGAFDATDSAHQAALDQLDGFGLIAIEQPFSPEDFIGHARLSARLATPVVLDESITNEGTLEVALELHAMDGISVKPARLGGLIVGRNVHDRCVGEGVHLAIGGMFETGIGRAAQLALGAMSGFDLPGDLGGSDRYFAKDLTPPFLVVNGSLEVPNGVGLGIEVDVEMLEATAVAKATFRAP
jgi:O-succinylbenzoate synthase